MHLHQISEPKLAHNAYLIGCRETKEAILVDPQRDISRYIEIAAGKNLNIVATAETHIHADYLTGLREFAERGIKIYVSDEGGEEWKYRWLIDSGYEYQLLKNGNGFAVGNVRFEAIHTPGHTPEHLCFLVFDTKDSSDTPRGILSGDFVFVGDVGRPDLLESAAGQVGAMEPAARELFKSLEIFRKLPAFLQVWPAHGAGSACGKALGDVPTSTVGYELQFNQSIRAADQESSFISFILEGQPDPPPYFARMKRDNRKGPAVLSALPNPIELSAPEIASLAARKDIALIDTRPWDDFRTGHIPASLAMPCNKSFTTNAGSFVGNDTPIYLIIDKKNLSEAIRDLIRIGLDNVAGYLTPRSLDAYRDSGGELIATEQIDVAETERRLQTNNVLLLDVRGGAEFALGHIGGSQNIAHTRLWPRMRELPRDRHIMVACQIGERSGYASAFLERFGFKVTHIRGGFAAWKEAGYAVVTGQRW